MNDIPSEPADDASSEVRISANNVANMPWRRGGGASAHICHGVLPWFGHRKAGRWRGQYRHENNNQIGAGAGETRSFSEGLRKAEREP
jgi:hypothetical protein